MNSRIQSVTKELSQAAVDAEAAFGALSVEQLNWKADEKSWSVAQCLDHLITTHSLYFPHFEDMALTNRGETFWEKYSPLSGFFGRFLIKSLDPRNTKKMKTTGKAQPSSSEIGADIVEQFCRHQDDLSRHIRELPTATDPKKRIITSPLLGFVTYSLDDAFTFLPMHCQRHLNQAKRIMETAGFPGGKK